jgi:DNA-binding response OmpR family regulator
MHGSKRVLIAEDSAVLGDVLKFNLLRAGYDVTLARNGIEALDALASSDFEVLVTDYEMPGLNGERLCSKARNELQLTNLRIIMCSAKGLELDHTELLVHLNIETILYKPFSIRELTAILSGTSPVSPRQQASLTLTS